jgi:ATP-dependent RNA helicase DeaD
MFRRRRDQEPESAIATETQTTGNKHEPPRAAPDSPSRNGSHATSENGAHAPKRRRRRRKPKQAAATEQTSVQTQPAPRAKAQLNEPAGNLPIPKAFKALGLDDTALQVIADLRFDEPTPIQSQTIPLLLDGKDVVGLAQTGTGKTLAFGLPLARTIEPEYTDVQALVLVPTRELANQVHDVFVHLGYHYGFDTIRLVGGKPIRKDFDALERGGQVIVGTPGRVIDHIKRGTLSLKQVGFAVLDEADEMLDIGFAKDIDFILKKAPANRQTALFSATMPMSITRLVWRYMRDSERVDATDSIKQMPADGVRQLYCEVAERDKFLALRHIYRETGLGRSLVFRRTKAGVDGLTSRLQRAGVPAKAIHGDLRQTERDRVMRDFRNGDLEFLVATNVAARGLDIPDIEHVINFDVPQNVEEYIHRVGRTARAGKDGSAITFVGEWELNEWDAIVTTVGEDKVEHLDLPAEF